MENEFSQEKIEKLKYANERLLIHDDLSLERNRKIIFVYCPPKVGSTSLVTSLRLFGYNKFNVLHVHNEQMLKVLYNVHVTVNDIIKYNSLLGKNVYVIDIYRSSIEHKMSAFFEKLEKFHFNCPLHIIAQYPIEKIIVRFNQVFPYLSNHDYYRNEYNILYPDSFDFANKYIHVNSENIQYIKLRLQDSHTYWSAILNKIFNINITIVRDYETVNKPVINDIFKRFKEAYQIPENFLSLIKNEDNAFSYYNNEDDRRAYISSWKSKKVDAFIPFTLDEYNFYTKISEENLYMNEIQQHHYIDSGCYCVACSIKSKEIILRVERGESKIPKIIHADALREYIQNNKRREIKLMVKKQSKEKKSSKQILQSRFGIKGISNERVHFFV